MALGARDRAERLPPRGPQAPLRARMRAGDPADPVRMASPRGTVLTAVEVMVDAAGRRA